MKVLGRIYGKGEFWVWSGTEMERCIVPRQWLNDFASVTSVWIIVWWNICLRPAGLENIENIRYFRFFSRYFRYIYIYIYQAFVHTLLQLYEIYYQIIVCVCALHIRWCTLVIHTLLLWRGAIWQKLSNTEKMLRAQVISQQNTQTENQNVVTMCHIKKYL